MESGEKKKAPISRYQELIIIKYRYVSNAMKRNNTAFTIQDFQEFHSLLRPPSRAKLHSQMAACGVLLRASLAKFGCRRENTLKSMDASPGLLLLPLFIFFFPKLLHRGRNDITSCKRNALRSFV